MPPRKFRFRLQTVLELKQKIEDEEKKKLAELLKVQAEEERKLKYLQDLEVQKRYELKEKQKEGGIDVEELKLYSYLLKKMANDIVNQKLRLQEIYIRVEEQREILLEATKEKKTYEKLKERHHERFVQEEEEEERKLIDELSTIRYAREHDGAGLGGEA